MTSKKRTVSELMASEKLEEVEKKSKEITAWMEGLLSEKLPKPTLRESLLDGVYLCKLVNVLAPNSLKKYHKKPKMLAMKIENIGFFLATCKTRLNLPPALLFQPTDLHDDSDVNSIRKVLNVLSFLQGDSDFIKTDDQEEGDGNEAENANEEVHEPKHEPKPEPKHEPKPEPKPEPKHESKPEPKPEPKNEPKPTPSVTHKTESSSVAQKPSAAASGESKLETDWYLHDQKSGHVDIQDDLVSVIIATANSELSVDSKRKLLRKLQAQISFVEEKILSSNDDQLRSLAHSMGLGESINDIPKSKGRDWLVEFILKYGRAH